MSGTGKISGNAGKKTTTVMFASADEGLRDKKFEGYSNLKGAHDQQQKRIAKNKENEMNKSLEDKYILNLHQ